MKELLLRGEVCTKRVLETSISAPKGKEIILSKTIEEAVTLERNKSNIHLLIIDARKMYMDGHTFILDKHHKEWSVQTIQSKYMTSMKL